MSNLSIRRVGNTQGEIEVSVLRLGNYITAGHTEKVKVLFKDNDDIRLLSANLNQMKNNGESTNKVVRFNERQTYDMSQSIWHDLADALLGFSICVDCERLGVC